MSWIDDLEALGERLSRLIDHERAVIEERDSTAILEFSPVLEAWPKIIAALRAAERVYDEVRRVAETANDERNSNEFVGNVFRATLGEAPFAYVLNRSDRFATLSDAVTGEPK